MNTLELKAVNDTISCQDGKIEWHENKGYTSKLVQYLLSHGWQLSRSGSLHILRDDKGHQVTTGLSHVDLLRNAAIVMR